MKIKLRSRFSLGRCGAFAPLGYCGVLIHGSMLLVAATTAFIPRYALPIDPILLVAGVLSADTIFAIGRRRFSAR